MAVVVEVVKAGDMPRLFLNCIMEETKKKISYWRIKI